MWFRAWLDVLGIGTQPRRSRPSQRSGDRHRRHSRRLLVEGLEQRQLLAFLPAVDFPVGTNPVAVVAADTLSITGTFRSAESANINGFQYPGMIGADLAEVYANSNENAWMLTLHGVGYSHDYYYYDGGYFYYEDYITRVGATSFDLDFFGPDAGVLNEVVSQQLVGGFFELRNGYQDGTGFADENGPYRYLELSLYGEGVSFYVNHAAWGVQFSTDEQGYPVVEPQLVWASYSTISDYRPGNSGGLVSFGDLVHIGSAEPPLASPPSLRVNDVTVTEGNTGSVNAVFTVTLSHASDEAVTVAFATANGTAGAGGDYTQASGNVTVPAGQLSRTFTIAVKGDRLAEPNETFFVNLSSPTNATVADGQGVGTILDDEPRISISDVSKSEGRKGKTTLFTFTVTLSAAYDQPVTMSYRTTNGTATTGDSDYIAKTGTLTFAPGETTKTISIEVKADNKREANETFYLELFGNSSNSQITKNRGIGTILNDD